jgi:capsular polysaccharide biosynthesis protein
VRDAGPLRNLAAAKLAEGHAKAAVRHARDYLQAIGKPAPVAAYPLFHPAQATQVSGVREIRALADAEVPSTGRLTEGLQQYVHWAAPYRPPSLQVLSIARAVALAPNLIHTADGQLLDDNVGFSNAELCDHQPADFNGIVAAGSQLLVALRHRDVARVSEPALYLPAPGNYAAWLFGSLPRLAAYAACDEWRDLPIVLHGDTAAYHLDSLRAMGITRERLRIHGAHVRIECKELIYCTTSYLHHAPSATGVRHVRERVLAHIDVASGDATKKRLYLARRQAKDRPLLNESEVIALLERHGFIAIDPEQHSFEAQVKFVAGAEMLVGPYGANLANMVFAKQAKKLLILGTKHQPEFARLASALGIAFWHTVPQAIEMRAGRTLSESMGFNADLNELERVLQVCLA